jgi:hypothetical protein
LQPFQRCINGENFQISEIFKISVSYIYKKALSAAFSALKSPFIFIFLQFIVHFANYAYLRHLRSSRFQNPLKADTNENYYSVISSVIMHKRG